MKALVLAAGLGTRLRPLTDIWPKPCVPLLNSSALELTLRRLQRAGIQQVAVNTYHLADQVEQIATSVPDLTAQISREDEILGTGGALNPLRTWLGDGPLLVINGDIVADFDIAELTASFHDDMHACLALLPYTVPGERGFTCANNRVLRLEKRNLSQQRDFQTRNFACAYILSPRLIHALPTAGSFCIIEQGILPALHRDEWIGCHTHRGTWFDLRTPALLLDISLQIASDLEMQRKLGFDTAARRWLYGGSQAPSVVDPEIPISAQSTLDHCLVLPGGNVPEGTFHRFLFGPGVQFAVESQIG